MDEILDTQLMHPRDQIAMIISRIYKRGLTTTSGGNISVIDENGDIWVTPSSVDKGSLRPSDIMCVKPDGTIIGRHKPSSEYPFHKAIYEMRPDIKAIIHDHPPALVSFSIVHEIPDTNIISQAKYICGSIGYATYELPGSDLLDAFQRFETLEFSARTILYGNTIGTSQYLTNEQIDDFEAQIPGLLPEIKNASYPSDEREKRTSICNIVHLQRN
jgi:L-fuculose-phosphate aldolase